MDPTTGLQALKLETLANGAADELFQHELAKVLHNIQDPNTDPKATRKVTIQVAFTPVNGDRGVVGQTVKVTSTLAGLNPITTTNYVVEKNGIPMAIGRDLRQLDAFEKPVDPSIRPISTRIAQEG